MDLIQRDKLRLRRELMQLRHRRRQLSGTFRLVARELCKREVRLAKSTPQANEFSLGPLAAGPGEDEELLFDGMGNGSIAHWSTYAEAADHVRDALAVCTTPGELVTVVWSPFEAGLRLRAADLAANAKLVLGCDWTTWIVAAEPSCWLIQIGLRSKTVGCSPEVPVCSRVPHHRCSL